MNAVAAVDFVGIALLVSSCATLITALAASWVLVRKVNVVSERIETVTDEVRTYNESTIGALAAAVETRRIEFIDEDDRTAKEQRHLDDAPSV